MNTKMKRVARLALTGFGLIAMCGAPARASDPGDDVPAQAVIQLKPGESITGLINPSKLLVKASFPARRLYLLQAKPGYEDDLEDLIDDLEDDQRVSGCEKNIFNGAVEGSTQSFFVRIPPPPDYVTQAAAQKLGLPAALRYSTGTGMTVAVLDTGLSPHSYLSGCVLAGYDWLHGVADTSDLPDGIDQDQDGTADEMAGHGTFVAGIIHTAAPNAQLLPVKVLDSDGVGTTYALACGIYYAIDRGAKIINISLAAPEESDVLEKAVNEALARGVVVVAAVPNDGRGRDSYPASIRGVIAVAAIDLNDRVVPTSGHGDHISLCAPGLGIKSVLPGEDQAAADGTSFSAAFVTGIATLTLAKEPWLTPAMLRAKLMSQAVNIDALNPGYEGELGAGRVTSRGVMVGQRGLPAAKMTP